jgi:hypothetical protein
VDPLSEARQPKILMPHVDVVKQVVPPAELRHCDGGHFVLDEFAAIAEAIIETFIETISQWGRLTTTKSRATLSYTNVSIHTIVQ